MDTDIEHTPDSMGESPDEYIEESINEDDEEEIEYIYLNCQWGTKIIKLELSALDYDYFSIGDLRDKIQRELSVPSDKQKLLGLSIPGSTIQDSTLLKDCVFKRPMQFMLVGSTDKQLAEVFAAHAASLLSNDVINDFRSDTSSISSFQIQLEQQNKTRLLKTLSTVDIKFLNSPRPDKKLLVIDLDYTVFDCKGGGSIEDLKRPYLEAFMQNAYGDYDLAIWSQTHWRWVEMKCTELGFLTNPKYKICFVLDRTSMFSISSRMSKSGKKSKGIYYRAPDGAEMRNHEVKALEIIWSKFPDHFSCKNTLHVDDLSRNFALNPKNGIKIRPYRKEDKHRDNELILLSVYLKFAASASDVRQLCNKDWRDIAARQIADAQ